MKRTIRSRLTPERLDKLYTLFSIPEIADICNVNVSSLWNVVRAYRKQYPDLLPKRVPLSQRVTDAELADAVRKGTPWAKLAQKYAVAETTIKMYFYQRRRKNPAVFVGTYKRDVVTFAEVSRWLKRELTIEQIAKQRGVEAKKIEAAIQRKLAHTA